MSPRSVELAHHHLVNTIFRVAVKETEPASNDIILRNGVVQRLVHFVQRVSNGAGVGVEIYLRLAAAQEFPTSVLIFVLMVALDTSKDAVRWTRVAYRLLELVDIIGCPFAVCDWNVLVGESTGELPNPVLKEIVVYAVDRLYYLTAWA